MTEQTLVLVKPDGVARALVGEIVARIERKGLRLVKLQLRTIDEELARQHYAEHVGKPFFDSLVEFITSGPLVAIVVQGDRAIAAFRQIAGGTDPVEKAATGSIRGDYALATQSNLVHGSDSPEAAAREIALWFPSVVEGLNTLPARIRAGPDRPGRRHTADRQPALQSGLVI